MQHEAWLAPEVETELCELLERRWSATTLAEPGADLEPLTSYKQEVPGLCPRRVAERWLHSYVASWVDGHPRAAWIVADPMWRPGNPPPRATSSLIAPVFIGRAAYYIAAEGQTDRIEAAWNSARSAVGQFGFVTTCEPLRGAVPGDVLPSMIERQILDEAIAIVLLAYDGAGLIVLEPTNQAAA